MSNSSFSTLNLQSELLLNLESLGYKDMTPIQAKSLPPMLEGQDIIAQAETGSGKTAAFGLAMLQKIDPTHLQTQALVLCPTRELADQVAKEIRKLARRIGNIKVLTLCGGLPFKAQASSLEYGAHIIVGTPGRIVDHLDRETLKLATVSIFVLDEADRMLDMGFQPSIETITKQITAPHQTLLFSATFSEHIKKIANRLLRNPINIKVEPVQNDGENIQQHFYEIGSDAARLDAVQRILLQFKPESAVIFCNTKKETQELTDTLVDKGFSALDLTGDLEQRDRDQTLIQFANKSLSVLVATDIAARGLDIENLDMVINYELAHDAESHIHRIGRTGRAGKQGSAHSLFSVKESYKVVMFEDYMQRKVEAEPLPQPMNTNQTVTKARNQTLQIGGGKKQKIRAGDILGALTGDAGLAGSDVGKIQIGDNWSYVAVARDQAKIALQKLSAGKLKGRNFRVRLLGDN